MDELALFTFSFNIIFNLQWVCAQICFAATSDFEELWGLVYWQDGKGVWCVSYGFCYYGFHMLYLLVNSYLFGDLVDWWLWISFVCCQPNWPVTELEGKLTIIFCYYGFHVLYLFGQQPNWPVTITQIFFFNWLMSLCHVAFEQDVKWLQTITSLPILVKGVLTAEDGSKLLSKEWIELSSPCSFWSSNSFFFWIMQQV